MSASQIKFSTGDLRSAAKEYQRDRNHNAKWARGFAPVHGKGCVHNLNDCTECPVKPQHRDEDRRCGRHYTDLKHNWNKKSTGQKTTIARKVFHNEVLETGVGSSDSSAGEEEIRDAAPVPDADVMYSYDAAAGPGKGTDILSHAVSTAVQRYESKVTEKLAKEYEFVDNDKDLGGGYIADADEDDFEMIDHASLQ